MSGVAGESSLSTSPTSSIHSTLSVGRAGGKRSLRTAPSTDTLSAHPLLASPPGPLPNDGNSSTSPSGGQYAVYRGRKSGGLTVSSGGSEYSPMVTSSPPPTSAALSLSTSGATHLPPLISRPSNSSLPTSLSRPPARSVSEAKEKLLQQQLQAQVQDLNLSTESAGWAMVQKLAGIGKESEWAGVVSAIASGKTTLLLPAEKVLYASQLTPTFFLDHLVLLDASLPSTSSAPEVRGFATLSGFRGSLVSDHMHFSSCGNGLTESARGIIKPGTLQLSSNLANQDLQRALSGAAYPQVPIASTSIPYPIVKLLSPISDLSVPRSRATSTSQTEKRSETLGRSPGASAGSRLAALFAKTPVASPNDSKDDLASVATPTSPEPGSPDPEEVTPTFSSREPDLELSVLAVSKVVRHSEFVKNIGKALDSLIRDQLKSIDGFEVEGGVDPADRIAAFAQKFQPPPNWSNVLAPAGKPLLNDSFYVKDVEEISDAMQDLLHATRLDLSRNIRSSIDKQKRKEREGDGLGIERDTYEEEDLTMLENRVDSSLERVEETLTLALYDRIFSPPSSGDAQEDENLSSRVAALNILDLTLDHLGLHLGGAGGPDGWNHESRTIRDSLEDIIGLAGKELQRLQETSVRTPRAKLAVFVNLHKIVVNGLSSLPPIPLKEEADSAGAPGPKANEEVEMDDASLRTSSRSASRSSSPPPTGEDAMLRTPRPRLEHANSVPEFNLPESVVSSLPSGSSKTSSTSSLTGQLTSSVFEATTSSVFDTTPSRDSSSPSTSSADLILPLLIYLVVQYNPLRLPSTLHYVQRFRAESLMKGEAAYCATNIHAVTEFINHADISALGLSSQKIKSLSDHSPVLYASGFGDDTTPTKTQASSKGRVTNVTQELDQFVDSANHALVNVVDSSYRLLFGPKGFAPKTLEDVKGVLDGAGSVASKARGTLLRRTTTPSHFRFGEDSSSAEKGAVQREMVDIGPEGLPIPPPEKEMDEDAKSVKNISSIIRDSNPLRSLGDKKDKDGADERPSLGDRLASIPGLGRFGSESKATAGVSPPSKTSLFSAFAASSSASARRATINSSSPLAHTGVFDTLPPSSHTSEICLFQDSSDAVTLNKHFLECEAGDLKLSEVSELLKEYKKLAGILEKVHTAQAVHVAQEELHAATPLGQHATLEPPQ